MPKGALPHTISNRRATASSPTEVMDNLRYLADLGNAMDEENVGGSGFHEIHPTTGARLVVLDVTIGHDHDVANGREVAAAGSSSGGVKAGEAESTVSTWVEVNQGRLAQILFAAVLASVSTFSGSHAAPSAPPGYAGDPEDLYTTRWPGLIQNDEPAGPTVAIDRDSTPHRLFVAGAHPTPAGGTTRLLVLMVGT